MAIWSKAGKDHDQSKSKFGPADRVSKGVCTKTHNETSQVKKLPVRILEPANFSSSGIEPGSPLNSLDNLYCPLYHKISVTVTLANHASHDNMLEM